MHVATPRNTLRSQEAVWRQAPNHILEAAHPWVAGALVYIAGNFADSAKPVVESWPFLIVGAVASLGLLWCSSQGLLA